MNLCLLVVDHDIIDPFTVVMVVKPEEIIGTSAVLRFHLAVILHIRDQNIDQFVVVLTDLAKSHRIIVEGSFLIMLCISCGAGRPPAIYAYKAKSN